MKNNIFKHKFLFILGFIFLLLFIFLLNNSYAFDVVNDDKNVELADLPFDYNNENAHYVICYKNNYYFLIFYIGSDFQKFYCVPGSYLTTYNTNGNEIKDGSVKLCDYDMSSDSWGTVRAWGAVSMNGAKIVYSSDDVYDSSGNIYFGRSFDVFSITLSTTEYSSEPIQAYSNWFDIRYEGRYKCYISTDYENWSSMNIRTLNDNNSTYYGFYYDIQYNGVYYFKCVDTVKNITKILTLNITNLKNKINIEFHLSNTNNTTNPIYILSNKYYYTGDYDVSDDFLNNYDIDISYGYDMPYDFAPFAVNLYDEVEQKNYRQYQYKIVCNGIYKLRILDLDTGNISYITFKVDNVGYKNKYGDDIYYNNYDENGNFSPTPVLFLEYLNPTTVRIRTQPFTFNELIYLECFVSSDGENFEKTDNIYKYTVDTSNSIYDYGTGEKKNNMDLYYFYFDVQLDGTYYFKFYNIESKEYTQSSIDVNIKQFINNNISNIDNFSDKMFLWARQHFGFLFYPFEFIVEFLNRVLNINYTEPILIIPELREPFFNNKILDETIFNFNSILSNSTVSFIYNIYLIVVDVILIFLFVNFCKNIFEEVFGK